MAQKLTSKEAGEHIGVADQTMRKWRCEGIGPGFYRLNGKVVYDLCELDEWLAARRVRSTSETVPAQIRGAA